MSAKHKTHREPRRPSTPGHPPLPPPSPNRSHGGPDNRRCAGTNRILWGVALAAAAGAFVWVAVALWPPKHPPAAPAPADTPPPGAGASNVAAAPASPPAAFAASAAPLVSGPRIQFATKVYDFGRATGDSLVDCLFTYTNTGNATLEISGVSSSCGCMKVGSWTREVQPGQSGILPVRYDSRLYTGRFAKSVTVTCNDPTQARTVLEVTGFVWRAIEITPPNAVLNLSAESPSNAAVIRLVSHLDEPLALSNLSVNSSAVAVALHTNQPGKEYQLHVHTLPPWPTNSQRTQITLNTSAPNVPVLNLNAFINYQPVVMTIPFQLRLPPLPLTNTFTGNVWVRNNGTNVLTVSDPAVNTPGVDIQLKDQDPGRQIMATLTFPAGFNTSSTEPLELRLKSSHPLFPILRVPILAPSRPASAPPVTPVAPRK
ncbi:MAG: DUF1573 domain-containing protein [Verrucomicrobia bacterium]|nr:DUF1573 domain-containing protein [Verrucomicrobiota bacterium]